MTKLKWQRCHFPGVKVTPTKMKVSVTIPEPMATYVRNASLEFSEGCVCDFIASLFVAKFAEFTQELEDEIKKQKASDEEDGS